MPLVYDLGLKFAGLAAFCGVEVSDANIGSVLYGDQLADQPRREAVARLKAGQRPLEAEDSNRLSAWFNEQIAHATGRNVVGDGVAPIRPEDWTRPLTEFFAELARQTTDEARLERAHAGILAKLNALEEYRSKSAALALTRYVGQVPNPSRFPDAAIPVDALSLPTLPFKLGEEMLIELTEPVARPSKGWLFFIRNPDVRTDPAGISAWIWDQSPADLIRWCPSPFTLDAGFFGWLPGFPSPVSKVEGEYTAYLLIEDAEAGGVLRQLQTEMNRTWDPAAPTFEPTVHLIARARVLFQKANPGPVPVPYAPPTLLMRRYRVTKR